MRIAVPIEGQQALVLDVAGGVLLDARTALLADQSAERIGLSVLALGLAKTALPASRALADRGTLLAMSGAALDLLDARTGLPLRAVLDLASMVAVAVLSLPAVRVEPTQAPAPVQHGPPVIAFAPMADPYDGTRIDGETWPEFAKRTNNGRKPGSEAALARWKVIDQEFSAPKEG